MNHLILFVFYTFTFTTTPPTPLTRWYQKLFIQKYSFLQVAFFHKISTNLTWTILAVTKENTQANDENILIFHFILLLILSNFSVSKKKNKKNQKSNHRMASSL